MSPRVPFCMFSRLLSAAPHTDAARLVPSSQNCTDIPGKFAPPSSFGLSCGGMQYDSCRKDQPRSHADEYAFVNSAPCRKGSASSYAEMKNLLTCLSPMHEKLPSSQVSCKDIMSCSAQRHSFIPRITMHRIRLSTRVNGFVPTCSSQSSPKFRIAKGVCSTPSCSDQRQHQIHCRIPQEVHLLPPPCV